MSEHFERYTLQVDENGVVTFPLELRKLLGVERGGDVKLEKLPNKTIRLSHLKKQKSEEHLPQIS